MSIEDYHPQKVFTVEEANKMLPLVKAIAADVVELSRDVLDRRQRLEFLKSNRGDVSAGDPYGDELEQMQRDIEKDEEKLMEYVGELRQLGVEPKTLTEGLLDFPAMMDGRLVYLCWKHGEEEVAYWHELEAGFSGRQPLAVAVGEEGTDSALGA